MMAIAHHTGAQRRPSHAVRTRGREGGGAGVAGRERRRQRAPHGKAGIALHGGPRSVEQPLEPLVDEQALGPEGECEDGHLVGPPIAGQPPRGVDEVPDEAEVAERGDADTNTTSATGCPRIRSRASSAQRSKRAMAGPSASRPGAAGGNGAAGGASLAARAGVTRAPRRRVWRRRPTAPRRPPARGRRRRPGTTSGSCTTRNGRSGGA